MAENNAPFRDPDDDLVNRFSYHPPRSNGQQAAYESVRAAGLGLARHLVTMVPSSPELANALDSVDQAVMWANAGISRR